MPEGRLARTREAYDTPEETTTVDFPIDLPVDVDPDELIAPISVNTDDLETDQDLWGV